jgi:crotonobetainyl-CoA:carnitine CoA-transferase CaiB-like acyl-CoA transferase
VGPLSGVKIVEFAGIGPGPMCAMLLADLGAEVLRIDRTQPADLGTKRPARYDLLRRNRKSVQLDLKQPEAIEFALGLISRADALIEGFRPGVMERLGLGPDVCLARNPRIVFGRMTGWGQDGPLAHAAGHDLNYIALTGALDSIGRKGQPPTPPLNLVGDYGGGALYLAMGILAAIIECKSSGQGQVVDAAMVDGAASLMTAAYGMRAAGLMNGGRGGNVLDSGAYYYDVYECADGKYVSIACIEGKFHAELLQRLGIGPASLPGQLDRSNWHVARAIFAAVFRTKSRDEWTALLEGTDSCFAPVLSMAEAPEHPHNVHRGTFIELDGVVQPGPAPRFSRTGLATPLPPEAPGSSDVQAVLSSWGLSGPEIEAAKAAGLVG